MLRRYLPETLQISNFAAISICFRLFMIQKTLSRLSPGILTSVVTIIILWLTLAPHPLPEADVPLFPHVDKIAHVMMFGGLVFVMVVDRELWCCRRYQQTGRLPRKGIWSLLCFAVTATLFGGVIELLQGWMGMGRGCDPADFLADGTGAALSAMVSPRITSFLLGCR